MNSRERHYFHEVCKIYVKYMCSNVLENYANGILSLSSYTAFAPRSFVSRPRIFVGINVKFLIQHESPTCEALLPF